MSSIVLGNGSNDVLELVALAFLGPGRAAVYLAARVRGVSARHAGARRARRSWCRRRTSATTSTRWLRRSTTRPTSCGSPTRTTRPAPGAGRRAGGVPAQGARARAGGARRGLQRVPAARPARGHGEAGSSAIRTWSSRAPSPRPTASPACASATRSRIRRVADLMNRVRQPFNVNSLALAAAAAALDDMEFVARSYAENLQGMRQLEEGVARARPRLHSVARQLRHRAGRQGGGGLQAAAAPRRDRAPGRRATACPSTCASPSAPPQENEQVPRRRSRRSLKE